MKAITALTILLAAALPAFSQEAAPADDMTPIFDGKTTTGWSNPYEWGEAKVVDGEIHLTSDQKFFLIYDTPVKDFVFEGEVKLPEGKSNSGFMFRAHKGKNKVFGYQAEVDGDPERRWSGGLYDEGRRCWLNPDKKNPDSIAKFRKDCGDALKRNDWNKYRITCRGSHIKIEVNGVVTTEYDDDMDAEGYLGIQHHGEAGKTYSFRNLKLKNLTAEAK